MEIKFNIEPSFYSKLLHLQLKKMNDQLKDLDAQISLQLEDIKSHEETWKNLTDTLYASLEYFTDILPKIYNESVDKLDFIDRTLHHVLSIFSDRPVYTYYDLGEITKENCKAVYENKISSIDSYYFIRLHENLVEKYSCVKETYPHILPLIKSIDETHRKISDLYRDKIATTSAKSKLEKQIETVHELIDLSKYTNLPIEVLKSV